MTEPVAGTRVTHRGPGIKHWRLIVRNLPFDTSKEDIEQWAGKFGKITEIVLPKSKDKRYPNSCAGFCFIQFSSSKNAEKANKLLNFTKLKGRKVAVDWALDKDSWVTKMHEEVKKEQIESDEENDDEDVKPEQTISELKIKQETESDNDDEYETCESGTDGENQQGADEEEERTTDSEREEEQDEEESETEIKNQEHLKHNKQKKKNDQNATSSNNNKTKSKNSNKREQILKESDVAIAEGRVVFLRNLPYSSTNEQFREWLKEEERYGKEQIKLAITCRNAHTGESNGSAFVHFHERKEADAFLERLNSEPGVLFDNRKLIGNRAISRTDAQKIVQKADEKAMKKDKRNLYLLRASLIRPGTEQARGMSDDDARLRERLGEMARHKLKNLLMFVSPTRLVIHNIPFRFTDSQLQVHCQRAVADLCTSICKTDPITECRIMRHVKGEDEKGRLLLGKSRGYAFVTFRDHATALQCLRRMNNNPDMFTDEHRPIVEFSIENLNALRIKERRLQQSVGDHEDAQQSNKAKHNKNSKEAASALEQRLKFGPDPEAVQRTKRELMAGGQKWMPKKLGIKVRHKQRRRDDANGVGAVASTSGPMKKRKKK